MEHQAGHDAIQRRIADALASAGADILWGHHPHVVQETEWLDETLVFYSLGNAVFDQQEPASVRRGELVWVEADRRGVRFYATLAFAIDARRGRIKSLDPFSFRYATRQPKDAFFPLSRDDATPHRPEAAAGPSGGNRLTTDYRSVE
jgi:poly-gamma-glutamate capsule biosynthesis protein CapA/YwtB (metallophosphatase superfamily)